MCFELEHLEHFKDQIIAIPCIHVFSFRIHEKDTATEISLGTAIQMALEHALTRHRRKVLHGQHK